MSGAGGAAGYQPVRRYRRRTVRLEVSYTGQGETRSAVATTLGAGGLFLRTDHPLPTGERVRVRFRLPGGGEVHDIPGRVAWIEARPEPACGRVPGLAIRFTDPRAITRLAQALERLQD